jgi:hypothetical protein
MTLALLLIYLLILIALVVLAVVLIYHLRFYRIESMVQMEKPEVPTYSGRMIYVYLIVLSSVWLLSVVLGLIFFING